MQFRNSPVRLPQITSQRPQTPRGVPKAPAASQPQSHRSMLIRAISLLQTHPNRHDNDISLCLDLLTNLQREGCFIEEKFSMNCNDTTVKNAEEFALTLKQRDMTIAKLKSQSKQLRNEFNSQLSTLLKKKIVMDAQYTSFDSILKASARQLPTADTVDCGREASSNQSLRDQNMMLSSKVISLNKSWVPDQVIQFAREPKADEGRSKEQRLNSNPGQSQKKIAKLDEALSKAEQQCKQLVSQLQESRRLNELLKEQLEEKNELESATIRELQRRVLEKDDELVAAQAASSRRLTSQSQRDSASVSRHKLANHKKLLQEDFAEKEHQLVWREQRYIQRIAQLQELTACF